METTNTVTGEMAQWAFNQIWQTLLVEAIVAVLGVAFVWGILWTFGKDVKIPAKKRKYFIGLVVLALFALVHILLSATRYFSAQMNEIRHSVAQNNSVENAPNIIPRIIAVNIGVNMPTEHESLSQSEIDAIRKELIKFPPQRPVGVTVLLELYNSGKPSVIRDWKMVVETPGKSQLNAKLEVNMPASVSIMSNQDKPAMVLKRERWLVTQCRNNPVETGRMVDGFLMFMIPGIDRETVQLPGTKFKFTFRDINDREYIVDYVVAGQGGFY